MRFQLTAFDAGLSDNVLLSFDGIDPVSGFPPGGSRIRFQFPPIIKSETKGLNWGEMWKQFAWEPWYIWEGATPRKITLTATYVVGGPPSSDVKRWTAARVATEMRRYKSYFYNNGLDDPTNTPLFQLSIYEHAPGSEGGGTKPIPTTWRGKNVSFKYSDSVIVDPFAPSSGVSGGFPIGGFPLRTDVTLELELATKIRYDDGKAIYEFDTEDRPLQTWY